MTKKEDFIKAFMKAAEPAQKSLRTERMWETFNFLAEIDILMILLLVPLEIFFIISTIKFLYTSWEPEYLVVYGIWLVIIPILLVFPICSLLKRKDSFGQRVKAEMQLDRWLHETKNIKWGVGTYAFSEKELNASGLFSPVDNMNTDDTFLGKHNGVEYQVAEMEMFTRIKNNDKGLQIFRGIVISFDCNKEIKTPVIVAPKKDKNINGKHNFFWIAVTVLWPGIILTCIYIFMDKTTSYSLMDYVKIVSTYFLSFFLIFLIAIEGMTIPYKRKMRNIHLESIEWDRKYKVLSKDEIESRYLITPAFMERFMQLKNAFGTDNIKCSFFNGKIMFAIATNKDFFEVGGLFTPPVSPKFVGKFYDEIESIEHMIDYFKLDEKTGL